LKTLAIFGGEPIFDRTLHVGRPNIGKREGFLERVNDMLDSRWLTNNGRYVRELELKLAEFLNVKHVVATSNATVGLEILMRALDLTGEVVLPSFTFVATAHAVQWLGLKPVFADVNANTHHLDPTSVERMITANTSAILGVHVWGVASDLEALADIAEHHNAHLLFDAAHAFGASYKGQMIGSFGGAEVFSFHATKFFNTFEGGAVTTKDDALADRLRHMRNFGFSGYDTVDSVGINAKMSEVHAAMGLTLLEGLDDVIATNHANYHAYRDGLEDIPGLSLYTFDEAERNNYQYIVVSNDEEQSGISRDVLVDVLHAENVLARRYFYPGCHQMQPYSNLYPDAGLLLSKTERLTQQVLSLPNGTAVFRDDIAKICDIIRYTVSHGPEITKLLAKD